MFAIGEIENPIQREMLKIWLNGRFRGKQEGMQKLVDVMLADGVDENIIDDYCLKAITTPDDNTMLKAILTKTSK